MAQETGQERTEQATPKRIREAREKGQIARSKELTTLFILLASGLGFLLLGRRIIDGLLLTMQSNFQLPREKIFGQTNLLDLLINELINSLLSLSPLLLLLVAAALFGPMALGGWAFSAEALSLKWERLNPVSGVKRIISWKSLVELVKALAKFCFIAVVAAFLIWKQRDHLIVLGDSDIRVSIGSAGNVLLWALLIVSSPLIIIAALDVPFQLWDHAKQLRMSRQEVRDENKETEGNPEVRARVRNIQREMARKRMMAEVPRADVIITNPTHYAVAIKYDQSRMKAPIVLAKGMDLIALQIRDVAKVYRVPIVSAPSLARSIYHSTPLNREIPTGLYMAVAQVLAYVYQLRTKGSGHVNRNANFDDMPIPDELRRDV